MTAALLLALKICVTVMIFGIGLDSTPADTLHLLRRRALLLRSLLAMYVIVPLAAFALVKLMPLPPGVSAGLLVVAVSAGAPLLPRKLLGIGDGSYVFSLVTISSVLAVVTVPAWFAVLAPQFAQTQDLSPMRVGLVLFQSFFLPLVAGMAIRRFFPAFATRIGSRLTGLASAVLLAAALGLLTVQWRVFIEANWHGILALAVLIVLALLIGHVLGGPDEDTRTALAVACATRHLGVAVMVATALPGPRIPAILAIYIATSAAISIPYLALRRRARSPRI